MKVSEADCGMSCIEMLKEQKFDLVFQDYMMPMTDGIETLKEIKNQHLCDGVPIISLTANAVVGAKEEFLSASFDDYLTKPIVSEKLDRMILSYLPKSMVLKGEHQEGKTERLTLPELDEFDFDYAMNILQDREILMTALQDFNKMLGALPNKLNDLCMNIGQDEMLKLYKTEVHALKSSAAMVGAMLLSKVARLLEMASIEKDVNRIILLHPILLEEIAKHKTRLLKVFPEVEEKLPIDNEDLVRGCFDMLEGAMLNDDFNTADFLCAEIEKYSYPDSICKDVEVLIKNVHHLDADGALQLIDRIKGKW